jgi:hypothetical protein
VPSVVNAGFVFDGDNSSMPLSEKIVSATPSAALEQLVPITVTIDVSAASAVAPAWPPSAVHNSSSLTSSTG